MAAAKDSAPRKRASKAKPSEPEFHGRIISIFGPFGSKALVEVSATTALKMADAQVIAPRSFGVIDAVDHDLAELRQRAPSLADSATAAAARALAFEIEHPYNSLTSKAQASKELRESMDLLRELAPPQRQKDPIDELADRRADRLAGGGANPAHSAGS